MTGFEERTGCRLCSGPLEPILSLGRQALAGYFPTTEEYRSVPVLPLELMQCETCGLVQLLHTVSPEILYKNYFYRSGVSQTMKHHLRDLAHEAISLSINGPGEGPVQCRVGRVLDIGCNDCTLLNFIRNGVDTFGIDPSDVVPDEYVGQEMKAFKPQVLRGVYPSTRFPWQFDLIFTVACFYDADDPVGFAKAVAHDLNPNGLWCVEVAYLPDMVKNLAYDAICHEHLCYYDFSTLQEVGRQAHLKVVHVGFNSCNGGSMRVYFAHEGSKRKGFGSAGFLKPNMRSFANRVTLHAKELHDKLCKLSLDGATVDVLGASTKGNVLLQYADVAQYCSFAVDRDPRKDGRLTPGTALPIITEEAGRKMQPDYYLVLPWHFRKEIVEREKDAIANGTKLIFPLPEIDIVER